MAVREFTDRRGRSWRAWSIDPDAIHPATKAEDYLADCYELGWIVFETIDEHEKRRLCPYPRNWETLPAEEMSDLLDRATIVSPSRLARERHLEGGTPPETPRYQRRARADAPAAPEGETHDVTDLGVVRSFMYPGGRLWSASVMRPATSGSLVLRFAAGARHIDLKKWPREWPDYPNERLIELLRSAAPRAPGSAPPEGTTGRRYDDRPSSQGGLEGRQ